MRRRKRDDRVRYSPFDDAVGLRVALFELAIKRPRASTRSAGTKWGLLRGCGTNLGRGTVELNVARWEYARLGRGWRSHCFTLLACASLVWQVPVTAAERRAAGKPSSRAASQPDLGADTAIVKTPTALFIEPNTASAKIASLSAGDLTILVSRTNAYGWYNVVQFSSGRQGWVKAERVIVRLTRHPRPNVDLRAELLGTSESPEVAIVNKSGKGLYLHLGSTPEVHVPPYSTKTITVPAGVYSYNIAAANVIPLFGSKALINGERYTWSYSIVAGKSTAPGKTRRVDPLLAAEVKTLQREVDIALAEVEAQKRYLDVDRAALKRQQEAYERDRETLESRRRALDRTDERAVDEFNRLVDATNRKLDDLERAEARFEASIKAYNTKVNSVNAMQDRLSALADRINGSD
jgi:hypothetical protein